MWERIEESIKLYAGESFINWSHATENNVFLNKSNNDPVNKFFIGVFLKTSIGVLYTFLMVNFTSVIWKSVLKNHSWLAEH